MNKNITYNQYKKYLDLGWSVVPWKIQHGATPEDKKIKSCPIAWGKYQYELPTEKDLKLWDGKFNALALVTGPLSGVVAVDIDEEPDPEKYPYLSSPVVVKSAFSGGRHYYYQYEEKLSKFGPQAKIEGEPMDYRGRGAVVILPESNLDGQFYEFEEFLPFALQPLPEEVYLKLQEPRKMFEPGKVVMFDEVSEGNRNQTATRVIGKMLEGTKQELWEICGWEPFRVWNQNYCSPPLPEHELRATYESVSALERRNRVVTIDFGAVEKDEDFGSILEKQIDEEKQEKFLSGYDKFDSITDGFRYSNTYLVAGLEKSGKSSWLMKMLQHKIEEGIKVGYVNTELPQLEFVRRMTAYHLDKGKDNVTKDEMRDWTKKYSGLFFYLGVENMPDQVGMIERVEGFVREGIDCLIFDNITSWGNKTHAGREGWQVMADLMDNLIQFTKRSGIITFMVIHTKPSTVENAATHTISALLKTEEYDKIFKSQALVVRKPSISDVYGGGGALSQVSGTILIWRPYQKFEAEFLSEKSAIIAESFRHAPNGMISASFNGATGVFVENEDFASEIDVISKRMKDSRDKWGSF